MDANERIEQFRQLCEQEPDNDMAWFSLGGAYTSAERHTDAAEAYLRCTEVNDTFSKAYQLAGAALIKAGQTDRAGEILMKGYSVAAAQGDLMPKKGIAGLLSEIGREPPAVEQEAGTTTTASAGAFICRRTGRPGTRMDRPPFRGPIGQWYQDHIARETLDEWIGLGTKIINELRLDLSRDQDEAVYDYGMRRFMGLSDDEHEQLTGRRPPVPPAEYVELIDTILSRSGNLESFGGEMHKQV